MLDFIDEHKTGGVVSWKSSANLLAEGDCISAEKKVIGFKVDFHDMVWGNATVKQVLLEEIEEKKTLPAASDSNQDLNEMVVLGSDKLVQKDVSFDDHCRVSVLKLCARARKFKTRIVYQFFVHGASAALNFRAIARKFKAEEVEMTTDFRIVLIEIVEGESKVEWGPKVNR